MAKSAKKPATTAKAASSKSSAKKSATGKANVQSAKKTAAKPGLVSKLKQALFGKAKSASNRGSVKKTAKPAVRSLAKQSTTRSAVKSSVGKSASKASVKKSASKSNPKRPAKPVAKKTPIKAKRKNATTSVRKTSAPAVQSETTSQTNESIATLQEEVLNPAPQDSVQVRKAVAVATKSDKSSTKQAGLKPSYMSRRPTGRVELPPGYKPSPSEEYMNELQIEYFRRKLLKWKAELLEESKQTIDNLRDEVRDVGDEAERATRETENSLELRTRDRYRKLIVKIDEALKRIEEGEYGYCIETGEAIGLERLEARPTAERTVDAQERWEHLQRQIGE